jgi:hypothetical protein
MAPQLRKKQVVQPKKKAHGEPGSLQTCRRPYRRAWHGTQRLYDPLSAIHPALPQTRSEKSLQPPAPRAATPRRISQTSRRTRRTTSEVRAAAAKWRQAATRVLRKSL